MITTHVLDTSKGGPAAGVSVILEMRLGSEWSPVARGSTDDNGRLATWTKGHVTASGVYRLTFDTGAYYRGQGISVPFFPEATVTFNVRDASEHHHLPLLLSPYGYTTY